MTEIPDRVIDAYVSRYPGLSILARNARDPRCATHRTAILRAFARNALRLACPARVTPLEVWHLAKFAESRGAYAAHQK